MADKKKGKVMHPFEHVYQRPATYIGDVSSTQKSIFVFNDPETEEGSGTIAKRRIKHNSGLLRIFIEAMSNAIDNLWRSKEHGITMKKIEFNLGTDPTAEDYGWISISNDGYCIPVKKMNYDFADYRTGKVRHEKLYPAEVFFGEMLAGTNFEEDDTRKTSGMNGIGGKAVIIFSESAVIEHTSPDEGKKFVQRYSNNGKNRESPEITSWKGKVGYTKVSFLPDYKYFSYEEGLDFDLFCTFKRFVYDCAMITGLTITLNGEKIIVKDLAKYARLYYPSTKDNSMFHFKSPSGDECVLIEKGEVEKEVEDSVEQVSWINGIYTKNGGTHVEAWESLIFPTLVKAFNSRKPKKGEKNVLKTTAKELVPYFIIFVRAEVAGAKFDSQTKDLLTEPPIVLADSKKDKEELKKMVTDSLKKILKWKFVDLLEDKLATKAERTQVKKEGTIKRRMAYGKSARDANFAGTKKSELCTLWVSEGDSAKLFVERLISGIPNGTDFNGAVAIRGKFINVQNATKREIRANKEVEMIMSLMRLVSGTDYSDPDMRKTLRYGRIIIAADQDDDGFHIRGLFLNFLWKMCPSLFDLRTEDGKCFISSISTAVVIASSGKTKKIFYSNPEFRNWFEENKKSRFMTIKYYKGLGTHKPGDEKMYLDDMKQIEYILDGEENDFMDLGFNKDFSNWRKTWITRDIPKPGEMLLTDTENIPLTITGELSLSSFVDSQLIIYHKMALRRALPNIYDGFKESQRKAFYGIYMDPDAKTKTVCLENLVGSIKKMTGYHHGGKSLEDTCKKMAQGFVGSLNIPYCVNDGEFGSRIDGGAVTAAARYISTCLEDITKIIYSSMDEPILKRGVEDGVQVEFEYYMPIIPMILVNGANGIASGYSTNIPNYNPMDLVKWIELWLKSKDGEVKMKPLKPWYRGYKGKIELLTKTGKTYKKCEDGDTPTNWISKGILEKGKAGWWSIKELPIGMWTNTMKEYLEFLWSGTPPEGSKKKKADKLLLDMRWKGTVNTVHWEIKPTKDFTPDMDVVGNFKNLQSISSLSNMHVIDENSYPMNFSRPEDLLKVFCAKRLEYYGLRKKYWLSKYKRDFEKESDRYIFVKAVIDKKLKMNQQDEALEEAMLELGLRKIYPESKKEGEKRVKTFDYLLSMQMRSIMSSTKLEEIKKEVDRLKKLIDELEPKTESELWIEDLELFKIAYEKFLQTRTEE